MSKKNQAYRKFRNMHFDRALATFDNHIGYSTFRMKRLFLKEFFKYMEGLKFKVDSSNDIEFRKN